MSAKDRRELLARLEEEGLTLRKGLIMTDSWPMLVVGHVRVRDGQVHAVMRK